LKEQSPQRDFSAFIPHGAGRIPLLTGKRQNNKYIYKACTPNGLLFFYPYGLHIRQALLFFLPLSPLKAAYTFSGLDHDNGQVGKAAEMSRTGSYLSGGTLYGR